jgi:hypothetical protein
MKTMLPMRRRTRRAPGAIFGCAEREVQRHVPDAAPRPVEGVHDAEQENAPVTRRSQERFPQSGRLSWAQRRDEQPMTEMPTPANNRKPPVFWGWLLFAAVGLSYPLSAVVYVICGMVQMAVAGDQLSIRDWPGWLLLIVVFAVLNAMTLGHPPANEADTGPRGDMYPWIAPTAIVLFVALRLWTWKGDRR